MFFITISFLKQISIKDIFLLYCITEHIRMQRHRSNRSTENSTKMTIKLLVVMDKDNVKYFLNYYFVT